MEIEVASERVQLLPEKALYLIQHKILLLADLHFGKVNHFRKAGIAVPAKANKKNAETLIDLIQRTKITPKRNEKVFVIAKGKIVEV